MGYLVEISADGTIVTIRTPLNDENGVYAGSLCIYEFNIIDSHWVHHGTDLDGKYNLYFGTNVSIPADATVIGINKYSTKQLNIMKWTTCSSSPLSSMPTIATKVRLCSTATYYLRPLDSNLITGTHSPFHQFLFHLINTSINL